MLEASNPDHVLIRRFLLSPERPLPLNSNGLAEDLRCRLQAWDPVRRQLTLRFNPDARAVQGNGVVHGGLVTAMLDFGLALCVLAQLDPPKSAVTVALHVHFEQAVAPGDLEVCAHIDRLGGRLAFASASLNRTGVDQVLARGTATLAIAG